jgi:hypothetical protein
VFYKNFQTRSMNKYHAIKTMYKGNKFDSKREVSKAMELDQLVKDKKIVSWSKQEKLELFGENGSKICTYKMDFTIEHLDGTKEYLEVKSKATATSTWRIKWKLTEDKFKDELRQGTIKLTVEY